MDWDMLSRLSPERLLRELTTPLGRGAKLLLHCRLLPHCAAEVEAGSLTRPKGAAMLDHLKGHLAELSTAAGPATVFRPSRPGLVAEIGSGVFAVNCGAHRVIVDVNSHKVSSGGARAAFLRDPATGTLRIPCRFEAEEAAGALADHDYQPGFSHLTTPPLSDELCCPAEMFQALSAVNEHLRYSHPTEAAELGAERRVSVLRLAIPAPEPSDGSRKLARIQPCPPPEQSEESARVIALEALAELKAHFRRHRSDPASPKASPAKAPASSASSARPARPRSPIVCRICAASFTTASSLRVHYRGHLGVKPFRCDECGDRFTRRHSLRYHVRVHQRQTLYACPDCPKTFRHPGHFKDHRRLHSGDLFVCPVCAFDFRNRTTLKRHVRLSHPETLPAEEPRPSPQQSLQKSRLAAKAQPISARQMDEELPVGETASVPALGHSAGRDAPQDEDLQAGVGRTAQLSLLSVDPPPSPQSFDLFLVQD